MSALREVLATGASTVCRAWVLRRADGLVVGFTDHDGDLTVDGTLCRAASGLTAGAVERGAGLAVDNAEVVGALSDAALRAEDVRVGRWNGAEVRAYLVDWSNPAAFEVTFGGALGEITEGGGRFAAELRGLADALNVVRGRVFHPRCDAVLGDARCGVDLSAPGRSFEAELVEVGEEGRVLRVAADADAPEVGGLAEGRCLWLGGAAEGLSARVQTDRVVDGLREVALWSAPRVAVAPGDRVRLEVGCDRTMATCRERFANALNFRGFPHLPGDDWLTAPITEGWS